MNNKIFIACAVLLVLGGMFGFTHSANAQTIADLQAQIQQLLEQVAKLQAQIAQLGGGSGQWCHDFNTNLRIGDSGSEVVALRIALEKEGLSGLKAIVGTSEFNEQMASIVVGFQEKYKDEILVPLGLPYGTGYVGSATRAKLNALYGCNGIRPTPPVSVPTKPSSITVLSPNGGETWEIGKTYDVLWNFSGPKECTVSIILTNVKTGMSYGVSKLPIYAPWGKYSFVVSDTISPGSDVYKIEVNGSKGCPSDESDKYFSIIASTSTTQPSITVLSPNGGETWAVGSTQTVKWTSQNIPQDQNVSVVLVDFAKQASYGLTEQIVNDGIETFAIPLHIPVGLYRVQVAPQTKEFFGALDESDGYITVVGQAVIQPSITVLSPNGGETWVVGNTYTVQWKGFEVQKGRWAYATLFSADGKEIHAASVLSVGTTNGVPDAQVIVPTYLKPGLYRLQITVIEGSTNIRVYDDSDGYINVVNQTTTTPFITVLSPNGGETLTIGQDYFIRWQANGLEKVRIYVETPDSTGSGSTNYITEGISNTGSYNWVVLGNTLPVSSTNRYKIRIDGFNTASQPNASLTTDRSDNYFSAIELQ